ncbi:MAG: hypothetical protein EAZ85_14710 [Bacteroidetes bacterium]|nr:MAG: hypothetical protein EAZ85_14710 [Bacteroidota bacterium]TAG85672.1 MAG: hypothetical protein EAZ20_14475 [Bacteroidota bacterium]
MKKIIFLGLVILLFAQFIEPKKDKTKLLARQWLMTSLQIENNKISEEELERQRKKGIQTILDFQKGGACLVYIKTLKKKTTKRNKWKFEDDQNSLVLQAENEPALKFKIEKLTSKKMILVLEVEKSKQVFQYESYKE